ncbi:hypothetical protein FACS1894184_14420 [Clostridia bacterium]|nr:hypothetical protein FACS1894184_14420 [Clostridia bacterium]
MIQLSMASNVLRYPRASRSDNAAAETAELVKSRKSKQKIKRRKDGRYCVTLTCAEKHGEKKRKYFMGKRKRRH